MLVTHEREKLCQAIVYFALHTNKLGKIKLFKLLYFLDFEHFKLTGRSVTGSEYFAWPKGPVPKALFDEFERLEADLAACVSVKKVPLRNRDPMFKVSAKVGFDPKHFSKRELKLLDDLSRKYFDTAADDMIEATHLENRPWHHVYEVKKTRQALIPYELSLNKQDKDEMLHRIREHREVHGNYK